MGVWDHTFDGNDDAADWFAAVFRGIDIDRHVAEALRHDDTSFTCRAAVYLLTVLGRSSYVWPGDFDQLDGHVRLAIARMEAMLDPEHEDHEALVEMCGAGSRVFTEIRRELDGLRAAHASRLT